MTTDASSSGDLPAPRPPRGVAPATSVRAHLECIAGPEKGQTFRIAPGTTLIGRDPSCEVVLSEQAVSRRHARIERRGEDWILVNLSSNGTRVERALVDEAVLAHENEIRVGARTRLLFIVESVAVSPTGRPQFRARTGRPEEAEAEEEEAEEEAEEPASLFQRRKKLFIGLGAYLGVMVLLLVVGLILRGGGTEQEGGVPILSLDDEIQTAEGERLRITRWERGSGYWVEDAQGRTRFISEEDVRSGAARRVDGMRQAIRKEFDVPTNPNRARRLEKQALERYDQRHADPANLFLAVRRFQQALGYYGGRSIFPEPVVQNIYREAVKELLQTIQREYKNAVLLDEQGYLRKADEGYLRILDMIPEPENAIVQNVVRRRRDLRDRLGER